MPTKAAKVKRTRAQRIPFRPGDRYSNKGRIHSRRPILSSAFFACKTTADHTFRITDYAPVASCRDPVSADFPSVSGSCIRGSRYSGDTPVLCAFCVWVRLLRHDFDTGHGRVSLHGNKAQQQLALSVGLKAREPANDYISLARFLEQIEILQQR